MSAPAALPRPLVLQTIPAAREPNIALDYEALFQIGMKLIRSAARETWNDHNIHDPGITTLELASFALTDLAQRANFAVEDLLASAGDPAAASFATPRTALTNAPVTEADYRRLLIDLPGVRNAWLAERPLALEVDPATRQLRFATGAAGAKNISLAGVSDVLLDLETQAANSESARQEVFARARAALQANRSLCEDFAEVRAVEEERFIVCAELELTHDANVSDTAARILFAANQYFAPAVRSYSLEEMRGLRKPDGSAYTMEEIFSGPPLVHGFIPEHELARGELRQRLYLSDLYAEIGGIDGVGAIQFLLIGPERTNGAPTRLSTETPTAWEVPVTPHKKPVLSIAGSRLAFRKRGLPIAPNLARTQACYEQLEREAAAKRERALREDVQPPRGRARSLASYRSIQRDFPAIYGLAAEDFDDQERKAHVFQLKAYLLFFDQLMADTLARLRESCALLAAPPAQSADAWRTSFHQLVDIPARDQLYPSSALAALSALDASPAERERQLAHRNRLLDHLVARFAERFHELANVLASNFAGDPEQLIRTKSAFLAKCSELGAARSLGCDRTRATFGTPNVSGLERRVCALLGIPDASRRSLLGVAHEVFREAAQGNEPGRFRFRITHAQDGSVLLSSTGTYASEREAYDAVIRALELARDVPLEPRGSAPDFYFVLSDRGAGDIAMRRQMFATAALRDAALAETQRLVRVGEGLHVVENLLLRPRAAGDPFFTICPDPDCTGCEADDPYSYRIHILLPAFAGRFADMDFRRFAEDVFRAEAPAHVLPKVCWLGASDLAAVEAALLAWDAMPPEEAPASRAGKLAALIAALEQGKSVYPEGHLHDCVEEAPGPPFVLGRTALGTHTHDED